MVREMDLNLQKKTQEELIEEYDACDKCKNTLQFAYLIDHVGKQLVESATCNYCGVRFEPQKFILN